MPVLETDFLKALIDPKDKLHPHSLKALSRLRDSGWTVASSAFIELDLLLKNAHILPDERATIFDALSIEIPKDMIVILTPASFSMAAQLQDTHEHIANFYFDSIHLALSMETDAQIVSSDRSFDHLLEVTRIPLEEL